MASYTICFLIAQLLKFFVNLVRLLFLISHIWLTQKRNVFNAIMFLTYHPSLPSPHSFEPRGKNSQDQGRVLKVLT